MASATDLGIVVGTNAKLDGGRRRPDERRSRLLGTCHDVDP
jgi:hypothetical protein